MKTAMRTIVPIIICMIIGTSVYSQDIYQAVKDGNTELVNKYLQKDPDLLNAKNQEAMTPLNLAAQEDQFEVSKFLLKKGADPLLGDNENSGPIHLAAISGSIRIVDLLQENRVDIDAKDDNGLTALHFALSRRQFEMAYHLVEQGADVKLETNNGWSTLQFAAIGGNFDLVKQIVEKKADVNSSMENGYTPLFSAVSFGHTDVVKYLVENGADINHEDDRGGQALSLARNPNTYDVAKYLIKKGADVNHKNKFNQTPLHQVAARGSVNVAEFFLEKGADINAASIDGRTPLTFAAYSRNPEEICKFLVLNGANVNPEPCKHDKSCTCGPNFYTPLHAAVRHGHEGMTKVLVSNGAKINVYDNDGLAPIHLAVQSGKKEIVEYLIDYGAFINCKEKNTGSTELHLAVAMGYNDIVELLIKNGSSPTMQDNNELTPFDYAWKYNHKELAYHLLAAGADDSNLEKYITETKLLDQPVNYGEASVWFLGHSGWAVKTQNHLLVFDYFCNTWDRKPGDSCLASGFILPEQIKDLPVTVFVTHAHGDHYDQRIFDWKNTISDIEYVLCWNQNTNGNEYTMIPIHEEQTIRDMNVYVNYSTDLGGGYVVEVDGLVLFHMGDHANGEDKLMTAFTDEIDIIADKNKEIDIVFGGIRGCSLGQPEQVKQGIYYTIEKLHPKLFVPMHSGSHSFAYKEFVETAKEDGIDQQMKYVIHKGDRFVYSKDL
ncbi:MAG: ankyrin repeat domain-containing protein, partial [Bacteroidales bacterium]|nr:ankyrin repeat domain-containing protein [Bacteroidales bacterium]